MSDLTLEAIKARDALWELWGDQYARMVRLTAEERDALVAEVERLRTLVRRTGRTLDKALTEAEQLRKIEAAVKRACTHDAHCEEEGEGACCFRAWRAVVLSAGCAQAVTHEDVELLAALHPQEPSDE